jgi:hypothetical protein
MQKRLFIFLPSNPFFFIQNKHNNGAPGFPMPRRKEARARRANRPTLKTPVNHPNQGKNPVKKWGPLRGTPYQGFFPGFSVFLVVYYYGVASQGAK